MEEARAAFGRNDKWDTYEQVKTVLMIPLVPLRFLAALFFLSLYYVMGKVAAIGLQGDLTQIDRSWWRHGLVEAGAPLMRGCFLLALGMWPVVKKGDPTLLDEHGQRANIIVCNHVSWMDVNVGMVACAVVPGYVCKKEVGQLPLIGFLSRVWDCAFVDRDAKSGSSIVDQLCRRAEDPQRRPIIIFPEGTTTNGSHLIHFHRGAFVPGAPVKPMIIQYPSERFSPAFDSIDGKTHLFRLLTQFVNYAEVTFLPVYTPNEAEKKDPALFAANVKRLMLEASGLGDSDVRYQDKKKYLAALRNKSKAE